MKTPACLDKETVARLILSHGTWRNLFYRCYSEKSTDYKNYGARGIVVCDEWHGDEGFYQFIKDVGLRESKRTTLDRIDVNKGYYPDNVKWATDIEQANNRRNSNRYLFEGENLTLAEISRKSGVPYDRVWKAAKAYGDPCQHQKFDPNNGKHMYDGEHRSVTYIANTNGIKPTTLMRRLRTGVPLDAAIARPLQPGVKFKEDQKWS
jgi:hypothetical protein